MDRKTLASRMHIDIPLLVGLLLICSLGLLVLYSAGGQDTGPVVRQAVRMCLAFLLLFCAAQIPPAQLARWSFWLYMAGVALLVLVLFVGTGDGARRWLDLVVFSFQPSEIMKLAVPMVLAWYVSQNPLPPGLLRILLACAMIVIPVVLIGKQPDLGTAFLVMAAGFVVLFIACIGWKLIAGIAGILALSMPVLWFFFMHDYQKQRVLTFINPEHDPLGAGYHIIQSKIAIGSGGTYGKGWLNGTQSHLEFLPERSTDFIFSVYCEEFGFAGVLLMIALYAFVIARGLYISMNAQHTFGRLLGSGLVLTFFVYIFVNMGMVTGQLPVVGVPLPLVSQGGTSMVTILAGFGILMAIHSHRRLLSG